MELLHLAEVVADQDRESNLQDVEVDCLLLQQYVSFVAQVVKRLAVPIELVQLGLWLLRSIEVGVPVRAVMLSPLAESALEDERLNVLKELVDH